MAFTEADRVQIRKYLGFAAIYLQAEPLLENAITAVQAVTDPGGTRPDNSTELEIKSIIVKLQAVDAKLDEIDCLGTAQTGKIIIDPVRGQMAVAMQGRRQVARLAFMLSLNGPLRDVYSAAPPANFDMPQLENGRRAY